MQISDVICAESWRRRDITLADTNCKTNVNFWADFAENVQVEVDKHVTIRNLRVGSYRGVNTINTTDETIIVVNNSYKY